MNKDDLVERVLGTGRVASKVAARDVVDSVFDAISGALTRLGDVSIHGFGTFKVKSRKARTCRNPHTGEPIQVKAAKGVGFKAAKALKEGMNAGKRK